MYTKDFDPETISEVCGMGYRGLIKLSENGLDKELHLSITDELNRERLFQLLDGNSYSEESVNKVIEALNNFIKVVFDANNPGEDVDEYTSTSEEGCDPGYS